MEGESTPSKPGFAITRHAKKRVMRRFGVEEEHVEAFLKDALARAYLVRPPTPGGTARWRAPYGEHKEGMEVVTRPLHPEHPEGGVLVVTCYRRHLEALAERSRRKLDWKQRKQHEEVFHDGIHPLPRACRRAQRRRKKTHPRHRLL